MSTLYFPYHMHTMLSSGTTNIDSITHYQQYVDAAKACGMTGLCISEHGNTFAWVKKKEAIEKAGMKYVHGVEAYITEDNNQSEKKHRDNYHCVLMARNYAGVKEINKLVSRSYTRTDNHFYYMPRIFMDELFATSENIIITSACLGGVLNNGTDEARERMLCFMAQNKERCYLEIQHHDIQEQIEYNKYLYNVSKATGIPLIVATDTHALDKSQMEGRAVLQKAKDVRFANEDKMDLTFKTPEELDECWRKQGSLPMSVVEEAKANSMKLLDSIEEFELDHSAKYPKLYDNSEEVFKQKINAGYVWRKIGQKPNKQEYIDKIHYEYETYKHNNAIDFMLLEEDYKSEMRRRGVRFGYSRGSVSGSIIAYLLGITEIDSIKYDLNFERFMNRERVSLADVDTDWLSEDRKIVKDYLFNKEGLYCCDIVTFNTIALKGAIKDVCRGLAKDNIDKLPKEILDKVNDWDKEQAKKEKESALAGCIYKPKPYPKELQREIERHSVHNVPFDYLKFSEEIIALAELDVDNARKKYKEVFRYVDMVNGVVVSVGNHPAGCVVSPYPVDEWFGTFTTTTDEYPISVLNMKEIDSLNFVKLDILGLDNIGLIYKTCDAAGIPFATPDNIPADDEAVWQSIKDDTTMIFQWESQSATAYLKQLFSDETIAKIKAVNSDFSYMNLLSIGNGAIRPAGESYRDKLANGEYKLYGNAALDEFMKPTLGYMVYQEQIIEFLNKFCGFTMGEADVVRRHFSKKTGTETDIPIIKDGGYLNEGHYIKGFIQTMQDKYGICREEAENLIGDFLQVIIDASDYLFSKNHADPYSWIGYICGYLRYYYPLEFITSALNIFEDKEEKSLAIIDYAKRRGITISPIKFRHSVAQYNFDKETNQIFKGLASIKYLNSVIADEIYALKDNQYDTFIDLLMDLKTKTSLDSRQTEILIDLDFFSEFGETNSLIFQYKILNIFFDKTKRQFKKQFSKDKLEAMNVPLDYIRPFAGKETPKMFTQVDALQFLRFLSTKVKVKPRTLAEKVNAQQKRLGYIDVKDDRYKNHFVILEVDTRYSPKIKAYSLRSGEVLTYKINKRIYSRNKLTEGTIVLVNKKETRNRVRKTENGFEDVPGVFDVWWTNYQEVDNL